MNRWVKLLLLLLPYVFMAVGILYALAVFLESESEVALNEFKYPFLFFTTGLVLGEFNKYRKDLS